MPLLSKLFKPKKNIQGTGAKLALEAIIDEHKLDFKNREMDDDAIKEKLFHVVHLLWAELSYKIKTEIGDVQGDKVELEVGFQILLLRVLKNIHNLHPSNMFSVSEDQYMEFAKDPNSRARLKELIGYTNVTAIRGIDDVLISENVKKWLEALISNAVFRIIKGMPLATVPGSSSRKTNKPVITPVSELSTQEEAQKEDVILPEPAASSQEHGIENQETGNAGDELDPEQYGESDPLYDEAVRIVTESDKPLVSLLQRRLKIKKYERAAKMIEAMKEAGLIDPPEETVLTEESNKLLPGLEEYDEVDPLYDQAVQIATKIEHGHVSISDIQDNLDIGYNRALKIIKAMEVAGVVEPDEIEITEEELPKFLDDL